MDNVHTLYPKDVIFCTCDECKADIRIGEWFYSIYWGRELAVNFEETQPAEANTSFNFCEKCADKFDFNSITIKKKSGRPHEPI